MTRFRKFREELGKAHLAAYASEISGYAYDSLAVKLDGTYTGTPVTLATDAPWGVLGRIKFEQDEESDIDVDPIDWYWTARFLGERQPLKTANTGANSNFVAEAEIEFGKLAPTAMLDARVAKSPLALAGAIGDVTSYCASGVSALSVNVRPSARVAPNTPDQFERHVRPWMKSYDMKIEAEESDANKAFNLPFDMFVFGALVRTIDADQTGDNKRSDGLVQRLRWEIQTPELEGTIYDRRWGEAKALTAQTFHIENDQIPAGVVWCPMTNGGKPRRVSKKSNLELHINSSDAAEAGISNVVNAAGDKLSVTFLGFRPRSKEGLYLPVFK